MLKLYLFCLCIVVTVSLNGAAGKCDSLGVLLYEDLGCKAVHSKESKCPTQYKCNFEAKSGTCLFRNQYIDNGELLPDKLTEGTCNTGCICQEDGSFGCPIIDCIEFFSTPKPGCYRTYSLTSCCSNGQNCQNETVHECHVEGQTYKEGQLFVAKDMCTSCICNKDFNGKFEQPHCRRNNCATQAKYSVEYLQKCAPVYFSSENKLCCPATWLCPQNETIVKGESESKPDLKCQFGNKTVDFGSGFQSTVYGSVKVKCECKLPPLVTCKKI